GAREHDHFTLGSEWAARLVHLAVRLREQNDPVWVRIRLPRALPGPDREGAREPAGVAARDPSHVHAAGRLAPRALGLAAELAVAADVDELIPSSLRHGHDAGA